MIQTVGLCNILPKADHNEHTVLCLDIELDLIISKKNYDSLKMRLNHTIPLKHTQIGAPPTF